MSRIPRDNFAPPQATSSSSISASWRSLLTHAIRALSQRSDDARTPRVEAEIARLRRMLGEASEGAAATPSGDRDAARRLAGLDAAALDDASQPPPGLFEKWKSIVSVRATAAPHPTSSVKTWRRPFAA